MTNNYSQPPEVVSPLTLEQLSLMFAVFMRSESAFSALENPARPLVLEELFTDPERFMLVAWKCYAEVRKTTGGVPPESLVQAQIRAEASQRLGVIPPVVVQQASQMVAGAYAPGLDEKSSPGLLAWARTTFHAFYADRVGVRGLRQQLLQTAGLRLADPRRLLQETEEKLRRADVLTAAEVRRVVGKIRPADDTPVSTGVEPWDAATGGGLRPRQIYGLFGPTGSFKTGFAVQLMVGLAKADHARRVMNRSLPPGQLIYFAYECRADEIEERFISCAAEIPLNRVVDILREDQSSGRRLLNPHVSPQMEEYEQYISPELRNLSEDDRIQRALDLLSGVAIQEMGGGESKYGKGYVPELVGCVENVRQQSGGEIQAVFIDYAKLMARRYNWATSANSKQDQGRILLSQLPDMMRSEVGEKYKTPVVILQQLDNQANQKQACVPLTHSFSSEAKDLGENMAYCLCLSKLDQRRNQMTVLNPSKTRYTGGNLPSVLRLDTNRSKLVPAEGFRVNEYGMLVNGETAAVAGASEFEGMFDV